MSIHIFGQFKDIHNKLKLCSYSLAGSVAGIAGTTAMPWDKGSIPYGYIGSFIALGLSLPYLTFGLRTKNDFESSLRIVSHQPDADIWKEELSKFYSGLSTHIEDYARNGIKHHKEFFTTDTTDPYIKRARIRAALGFTHSFYGGHHSTNNLSLFPEGLVFAEDWTDFDKYHKSCELSKHDNIVLDMIRTKDKTSSFKVDPDVWFMYLKYRDSIDYSEDKIDMAFSLGLDAQSLITFLRNDIPVVEDASLDGITL